MPPITAKELTDRGICPTCYDREHDHAVFGDNQDKMLYEDELFECFLVGNPRAPGHTIISTKTHYKDMTEASDEIIRPLFVLARQCMIFLKEVYKSESVYLCTMCDGPMNHLHIQLIPRYDHEERGSRNFVKERRPYEPDPGKIARLRALLTAVDPSDIG